MQNYYQQHVGCSVAESLCTGAKTQDNYSTWIKEPTGCFYDASGKMLKSFNKYNSSKIVIIM